MNRKSSLSLSKAQMEHLSVLKADVQKFLQLAPGEVVVDATLGLGGHSLDILKAVGGSGKLIAFEQDERNLQEAKRRLKAYEKQIVYVHDNFCNLKTRVNENGFSQVDAILFDLGLSSPHVDEGERGFSFMKEAPLDMRFDQRQSLTAEIMVNTYEEEKLAEIFHVYGEEPMGRKIARMICERRKEKPFTSTTELAEFVAGVVPKKFAKKVHGATRVFQALRIAVNDELEVLKTALRESMEILKIGGRVVIISYHSLEDRIVKHFFKELERPVAVGEESIYSNFGDPFVENLAKKPVVPDEEEIKENPRSRSAKLRAYKKLK